MSARSAYPKNVPGDFYVEENCCLWCAVPETFAPEHFGMDDKQRYIKRQPVTETELRAMISAMSAQDLFCIRYRGDNQQIKDAIRDKAGDGLIDD